MAWARRRGGSAAAEGDDEDDEDADEMEETMEAGGAVWDAKRQVWREVSRRDAEAGGAQPGASAAAGRSAAADGRTARLGAMAQANPDRAPVGRPSESAAASTDAGAKAGALGRAGGGGGGGGGDDDDDASTSTSASPSEDSAVEEDMAYEKQLAASRRPATTVQSPSSATQGRSSLVWRPVVPRGAAGPTAARLRASQQEQREKLLARLFPNEPSPSAVNVNEPSPSATSPLSDSSPSAAGDRGPPATASSSVPPPSPLPLLPLPAVDGVVASDHAADEDLRDVDDGRDGGGATAATRNEPSGGDGLYFDADDVE